jgi:hypothetical protein
MVIRALADLPVMCVLPNTFPSPITRGANPVATLASADKHSYCRRCVCILSGEAKERQQAFLAPLPGKQYALDIFSVELSQFIELSFSRFIHTPFLAYGVVPGFNSFVPFSHLSRVTLEGYSDSVSLPFERFLLIYHNEPRRSRRQSHLFHG